MSVAGEKKFVLKHIFKDLKKADTWVYGDIKEHFGIPWRFYVLQKHRLCVECFNPQEIGPWSVEVDFKLSLGNVKDVKVEEETLKLSSFCDKLVLQMANNLDNFLIDGDLIVELEVKINKSTGIRCREHLDFGEDKKEFSDVVLVAGDQKSYVNKMYLAYHSTYFQSLFLGNFEEAKKSIIELKDIDPEDLQNFLDVLYGASAISDYNVEGILKLADMYDAKVAIIKCEEFLLEKSKLSPKIKFEFAERYKLDVLKVTAKR
ncbi:unnamed protein product [Caenorhabditis nigoni]